jgi:hypothetical protein
MKTGTIDRHVPVRTCNGADVRGGAMINLRQILLGLLCLLIGTLVYLIDRPPEQTLFVRIMPVPISLYRGGPPLFGPLGNVLPDFLHAVAFILLTAGVLSCGRRGALAVSLFWLSVDGGFELGQKYSALAAGLVPDWFDGVFLLDKTRDYFRNGVYSSYDMIAIVIGAAVAYLIVIFSQDKRRAS